MKRFFLPLISALILLSPLAQAGQSKDIGTLEVHYSAFNSTFITPQVAKAYNLTRSGVNAIINIAVLDKAQSGKPALTATLTGEARNLLGTRKPLVFREVREGDAIYYLAELRFANEENYTFTIDISAEGNRSGKLTFNQVFYAD
ncbi:DUF4426 domain-containing protein [Grimontia hollisae]|uniref:DUF4426 domain-containing protein n=2 Tax=Grimontia hollisae TaxID=673 RepID=D0I4Q4_GRIHO|nr:DUF4426 domain-containing protein [Grimontia hollisae]AMG30177.1 DUF4426 domain-containing protein [Grimontia hollisae]EEY73471.1 hypothetical protein VHA_000719 [Grimontia hollisae CIP 101886]MDF2183272.1 DUF4426 domain-containing protein [Grimontia hollisae]STO42556.1 Uncharacterised protein [Grimontia hollisae]STO56458.1 Uncharacterised protein [Grimontia hollisae]